MVGRGFFYPQILSVLSHSFVQVEFVAAWKLVYYGCNISTPGSRDTSPTVFSIYEEVSEMPITVTIHIAGYTVTITIKKQNRHSHKRRFKRFELSGKELIKSAFLVVL